MLAIVDREMADVEVLLVKHDTGEDDMAVFVGRRIASSIVERPSEHEDDVIDRGPYGLYLTKRHRFALVWRGDPWNTLEHYDTLDDAAADGVDRVLLAAAAQQLGESRPVRLDT